MKIIHVILFFLTFNVLSASAAVTILFPSAQYYLVEGDNQILWTYDKAADATTSPTFSIYLNNDKRPELNKLALANNVDITLNKTTISAIVVDTGFQILFIDTLGTTIAMSESFEVKPLGTTPAVYVAPTPTPSQPPSSSATAPAGSGGGAGATAAPNSSNSIHNYDGFGVLVLITLFTVILF